MRQRFIIAFVLALGMFACGPAQEQAAQLTLTGGIERPLLPKGVVRIAVQGQSICGGVLVAADLVVTAAHCLKVRKPADVTVVFPESAVDNRRLAVEFRKLREDSLLYFPNFDIAWIRLSSQAPAPYKPVTILGESASVRPGSIVDLIGPASDARCHPTDPQCRLVALPMRLKSSWSSPHLVNLAVVENQGPGPGGTCPGDSGGPGFISRGKMDLVYGIVAGKDPVFSLGEIDSCGSAATILTRLGEYQDWIETTSGRSLLVEGRATNRMEFGRFNDIGAPSPFYETWQQWFTEPEPHQSSWATVHKILEQAVLEFQATLLPEQVPQLFQTGGQEWIERMTTLRTLTLGFPDQTMPVDDLRPLAGLKNLTDLTFLARRYQGLETLNRLKKLNALTIIGKSLNQSGQSQMAWNELSSPTVETLRLSQLPLAQIMDLDWRKLPRLRSLIVTLPTGKVPSSWLREERLGNLQVLQIQELQCDQDEWPKQVWPQLKNLSIRSTASPAQEELACIRWDRLPGLTEVMVQGYRIDIDSFTANMPSPLAAQILAPRK